MSAGRQVFVAARDSNHRHAACCLYRALVRAAKKIDLPSDVKAGRRHNPIVNLIRKRYANNANLTSFRLLYSSMSAGYKFVNLLTAAQDPESVKHRQVIDMLRERAAEAKQSRKIKAANSQPQKKMLESEPHGPIVRNMAKPGEPPLYVPNPKREGRKPSRPPMVAVEAHGVPFIRFTKPQPAVVGKMIFRRRTLFANRMIEFKATEDRLKLARLEDEWDRMVEDQIANESGSGRPVQTDTETYQWSVLIDRLWYQLSLERLWEDWAARGTAYHQLVEMEHAERSGAAKDSSAGENAASASKKDPRLSQSSRSQSGKYIGMLALAAWYEAGRELAKGTAAADVNVYDLAASRQWAKTVELQTPRLRRDFNRTGFEDVGWLGASS